MNNIKEIYCIEAGQVYTNNRNQKLVIEAIKVQQMPNLKMATTVVVTTYIEGQLFKEKERLTTQLDQMIFYEYLVDLEAKLV